MPVTGQRKRLKRVDFHVEQEEAVRSEDSLLRHADLVDKYSCEKW